jgi:PAS domain S-box-containing protein
MPLSRGQAKRLTRAFLLLLSFSLPLLFGTPNVHAQGQGQSQNQGRGAPEPVTLQLRWKHQFQFAGYYAAQQEGFYRDAGLDVNIVEAQDGQDPIQRVVDGEAEFGVGNSELVLWRSQGKPVVVLGVIFQHSPLVLLTTRESGIQSLHDLVSKRVAIEANSAELLAYFQDEGIALDKLTIVNHEFDPQALIDGEIDAMSAYSTDEPFLLQNAGIDYQVFSPRSAGIDFYGDVLFTTEDEIQRHPARVQAFLDASMAGWKYAFDHQDQMIDYIYNHLTPRHSIDHLRYEAEQMRRLVLPDLIEPGYMYEGRWRAIVDTYARVGLLPQPFEVTDMLYLHSTSPDQRPLYTGIALSLVIAAVVGSVSLRYYRLNRQLRRQVDEREHAQAQLEESEARYRSLVETAPFAVLITRLSDNTIRFVNARAEAHLKLSAAEAVGKPAVNFYANPADRARFIERVRSSNKVEDFEVCLRDQRGGEFWAAVSTLAMSYEGQPAIFVTFKDISERRWMEDKLRASEALYRSVLNASPDAVVITDLRGIIQIISPAGQRMWKKLSDATPEDATDTAPERIEGQPLYDWAAPESRADFAEHIRKLLDGVNWGTEQYRLVAYDGAEIYVEVNAEIIRDAAGQPSQLVFIIRDITERKAAESQRFALAVEQERVNVLSAFIQNASHEFRTPLAIINSSIYLLSREPDEARRKRHVDKAEKQIAQIAHLVDMLTMMARLDSGERLTFAPVDLASIAREAADSVASEFQALGIRLRAEAETNGIVIQGDSSYLMTAFRHLLENARRFTPAGGDVVMRAAAENGAALLEVRDTGIGISPEALPHIFERFWREDEAHSTPGFGLGLALVRAIITAHGGEVEAESTLGQGAVFRVRLPLAQNAEAGHSEI